MSSKPRRLAVLAVATTLAAATSTAQGAPATSSAPAHPSAHWVVVPEAAAVKPAAGVKRPAAVEPPANVAALARDLGVDTGFAWKTLDELVRKSGPSPSRAQAAPTRAQPGHVNTNR
jgi:hypothetical protein